MGSGLPRDKWFFIAGERTKTKQARQVPHLAIARARAKFPTDRAHDCRPHQNMEGAGNVALCEDFLAFEEEIKKLRKIDDNIVYALNTSIATESIRAREGDASNPTGRCSDLWSQLHRSYNEREQLIKSCVKVTSENLQNLRAQRDGQVQANGKLDPIALSKQLRNQQTQLRLLQKELSVEEVIKERSTKIFHEKCRAYFRPPSFNSA